MSPCRARGCTRFATNPAFDGYCRHCWVEACAAADRDRGALPPWADRQGNCLCGLVLGAAWGYFGGHLALGPDAAVWLLLLGGALGARIGWGRGR